MQLKSIFRISILLLFIFSWAPLQAQLVPGLGQSEEEEEVAPEDPLGRNSPRGTVRGFLSAVANQNYQQASQYLNLEGLEEADGQDLSLALQRIMDQADLISYAKLSQKPTGFTDDNLAENVDRVGSVTLENESFPLTVERTEGVDGEIVWLFSTTTMKKVAKADVDQKGFINSILPAVLQSNMWKGAPVGQWLVVLILIPVCYYAALILTSLLIFIIRKAWPKANAEPVSGIITAFKLPLKLYLAGWLFVFTTELIGISIIIRQLFSGLTIILGTLAVLILLWRLAAFLGLYSRDRMIERGSPSGVSVVIFLQRAARVLIVVVGFIAILSVLGIDVTAGVAALGIGGIALALGAQKSMENLVGGVTLIADQPIRVGDFCKVGDIVGTIESIGIRSTRIRTLARTVITLPNGEFSSSRIENYAHRDKFWFNPKLSLRYETSPEQIRFLLVEIRSMLYSHPKVSPEPARIRFEELGADSLNLGIFAYVEVLTFDEYLEVQEDLLLRIMDIVESSGTGFAFPSQTIYMARDSGLSEEKTAAAEARVKKWRKEQDIQIPRFEQERIEKLRNSISFPPEGSVQNKKEE
jgi:MscS family membrane protein